MPDLTKMSDPDKNVRPPTKLSLTKIVIGFILIDRCFLAPLRDALRRKTPLIKITVYGKRRKAKRKKKGATLKTKIFGWTVGAILGIGIIAVLAVSIAGAIKAKVAGTNPAGS